ncbi:MAG TPA: ABC transporter permease, partial [Paraburkholderia sp.]|nr:ABC transporter permease [Paraburkholderia sp.]
MTRRARWQTIVRRTASQALPTVIGIVVLNFFLLKLMPGDAADVIAGEAGSATAETMTMLRTKFGLDQPVLHQLWSYLSHLAHFSLGYSPRYDMPVMQLILSRLPNTLLLMGVALSLALVVGVALGAVMAHWAGKWPDRVLSVLALLFYSTPGFWFGLLAIVLFSVRLGWLPSGGNVTIGLNLHGFAYLADLLRHVLLPATTLATFFVAIYARLTR